MLDDPGGVVALRAALVQSELTVWQLWLRYIGLGGNGTASEVADHLDGRQSGTFDDDDDSLQHDTLVHALNERFMEMGFDYPVPYRRG